MFAETAFVRQYTERYTYEALVGTLRECLGETSLAQCMREGALMDDRQAVRLAGAAP